MVLAPSCVTIQVDLNATFILSRVIGDGYLVIAGIAKDGRFLTAKFANGGF
jgi:hypothetical protein